MSTESVEHYEQFDSNKVTIIEPDLDLSVIFNTIQTVTSVKHDELARLISKVILQNADSSLLELLHLQLDQVIGVLRNTDSQNIGIRCFQNIAYYGRNRGVDEEGISNTHMDSTKIQINLLPEAIQNLQEYGREGGDNQLNIWISSSRRERRNGFDDLLDDAPDGPGQLLSAIEYVLPKGALAYSEYRKPEYIGISFYDMQAIAQGPSIIESGLDNRHGQFGIGVQNNKFKSGNVTKDDRQYYDAASKEFAGKLLHTFIIKI